MGNRQVATDRAEAARDAENSLAPMTTGVRTAIPILLYHSVSDDPPRWLAEFTVTPRQFQSHLELIVASGRTPLTVSALVANMRAGTLDSNSVAITFDDGHADFAAEAAPRLVQAGLCSTLYVTTGGLEGSSEKTSLAVPPSPMLAWSSLRAMERDGVEIGSHSHTHPELDTLRLAASEGEIVRSKQLLEGALGHEVATFAYPHGYSSRRVRTIVEQVGFTSACGVREALSWAGDDVYNLARLTVRASTPLECIRSWLAGEGAPIARSGERTATKMWRYYRRARRLRRWRPH